MAVLLFIISREARHEVILHQELLGYIVHITYPPQ